MPQLRKQPITLAILVLSFLFLFIHCSRKKEVEKKQIILISIDTLRGDHITPYGYFRDTSPKLNELVDDSVYYTHAYTNGCWTHPSHMSLLTGTLPSRHGINKPLDAIEKKKHQKLNESLKNIAEVVKTHGVQTIKFAKLPNVLGFGNGFDINNVIDPFAADYYFEWLWACLQEVRPDRYVFFLTAVLTGCRRGELLGLQVGNLDFHKNQMHIRRSLWKGRFVTPKSKCSTRSIDMSPYLVHELKKHLLQKPPSDMDLVFCNDDGKPINPDSLVKRHFHPALRRAKLRRVSFHSLRHSNVALRIEEGQNIKYIQRQLGHASIQTTLDRYGHLISETNQEGAKGLDLRMGFNVPKRSLLEEC